jgi:DNA-binding CsgD family transcriptional regulator
LRELIPCHHAGYTTVELGTVHATVVADPPDSVFPHGPEIFSKFAHQNPMLAELAAGGEMHTRRLSDHITRRELHRTDLYDHVYRHISLEYQLGAPMYAPGRDLGRPTQLVGLSLARERRDFSDEEKQLLELIRPALSGMLERLHEIALLRAIAAGGAAVAPWLVLLDGEGTIAWSAPAAADALELRAGRPLPGPLGQWFADAGEGTDGAQGARVADPRRTAAQARWSSAIVVEGVSVLARRVDNAYPGLHALYLRELRPRPTLAALERLGLTRRQAQVLQLMLLGRSAAQIAPSLSLSTRTVEKHMQATYARLGAGNRSEAIAIASRAL